MPVPPASGLHKSVRDALPVRLGDRKYNIDVTRLVRSTIDPIRQGFDTQGQPGEQSLNQAGVWRRSRNDWELGAGQREADSPESALRRFNTSLGVNPWVKNELTLHKATAETRSTSNSDLFMVVADSGTERAYIADGSDVYQSTNGTAWTVISNPAGGAITAMATDGYYVYVASAAGAGEIQRISGTAVSGASLNTDHWVIDDVDGLWIANGYLITSIAKRLTVVSVGSALATNADITSAAFTQVSEWKSVIGTPVGIYAAGNQGDQGKIYYVGINDSTSALNVPVIVAELPLGEKINVLAEYGGLLIIGTTKGIRVAQITGQVAEHGIIPFFTIMAYISISLGLINLFPIPMLDGGHLMFYLFEAIFGKPLSQKIQEGFFRIGLFLLLSLMFFVTFNDLKSFGLF